MQRVVHGFKQALLALSGFLVVGLMVSATGCGSGGGGTVATTTRSLTGSWSTPFSVPGANTSLTMTQRVSSISGSGTYAIEAGRSGTLQISGTVTGSVFTLTINYDYGATTTYTGTIVDANDITGTVHQAGSADYSLSFVRK